MDMKQWHQTDELSKFIEYEILSSYWAGFISIEWMQQISANYLVWKATTKFARYQKNKSLLKDFKKDKTPNE